MSAIVYKEIVISNPRDNLSWQLFATATISYTLAVAGTVLRIYSRGVILGQMRSDDWLLVSSLFLYTVFIGLVYSHVHYGSARHILDIPPDHVVKSIQRLYFAELTCIAAITNTKAAIGVFFLNLSITHTQRRIVWCAVCVVVVSGISFNIAAIFQCNPIPFFWQRYSEASPTSLIYDPSLGLPEPRGWCADAHIIIAVTYAHGALSTVTGWVLVFVPISIIFRSNLEFGTKTLLCLLLLFGALASVSTLVRFAYFSHVAGQGDFLWTGRQLEIWATIEPGFALFAAGLAATQPLLRRYFPRSFTDGALSVDAHQEGRSSSADDSTVSPQLVSGGVVAEKPHDDPTSSSSQDVPRLYVRQKWRMNDYPEKADIHEEEKGDFEMDKDKDKDMKVVNSDISSIAGSVEKRQQAKTSSGEIDAPAQYQSSDGDRQPIANPTIPPTRPLSNCSALSTWKAADTHLSIIREESDSSAVVATPEASPRNSLRELYGFLPELHVLK